MPDREVATKAPAVAIVTDSAACLPPDEARSHRITVLPFSLTFGNESFPDGALEPAEFYRRLSDGPSPPTTAGVPPGALVDAFRSAGGSVVCITVSSRFSSTHASALQAADLARRDGIEVVVVDSQYATMAEGFVVRAAARAAAAGGCLSEVVAAAEGTVPRVGLIMLLESLDYLARGGRVPRVAAWASSLLRVRPLVEFRERQIRLAGRARSRRRGLEALVELLERRVAGQPVDLVVHHSGAPQDASWLADTAEKRLHPATCAVSEFTQVMTAHVGPGLVGFAYRRDV